MEELVKKMRLREWLIAQIDSGKYAGLTWENEDKTMFRIPWKHAAKQDYSLNEDAALFKAWAVYKGKYREGRDKADPTTWKTRLRCAFNKSTDFKEVPERSQLDVSEPYKVYHIQAEPETGRDSESPQPESQVTIQTSHSSVPLRNIVTRHPQFGCNSESEARDGRVNSREGLAGDHVYYWSNTGNPQRDGSAPLSIVVPTPQISDLRVRVCLFYQGQLVVDVTTSTPDGCFLLQGQVPLGNERIYGPCAAQQVPFPPPGVIHLPSGIAEAMGRLLPHLERGVLVWVAPDGVFIKRFCQGRVYWSGPLAQHTDRPNKLDRERTCKLLDTAIFLKELQDYIQGAGPKPRYEIDLCFGEEFPDASQLKTRKLIIAQVVPLFAVNLLHRCLRMGTEGRPHLHTHKTMGEEGEGQPHPLPQM
ncbi:interferon regulatory factor 4 isoform X1 [Oncorhynchus tshawytscha]|uniref:IRF tryptophan pentad repeat domain-containing protein n=1 Tax=Oncorhynchus tshawytscha TaxID=74940 RepID=A0A8C8FGR6_ONCTS|nr:interferon regulatory factor 4 isoform X1 [Oncorhynchus tshawytscha]